jgi:hypothetical protein
MVFTPHRLLVRSGGLVRGNPPKYDEERRDTEQRPKRSEDEEAGRHRKPGCEDNQGGRQGEFCHQLGRRSPHPHNGLPDRYDQKPMQQRERHEG